MASALSLTIISTSCSRVPASLVRSAEIAGRVDAGVKMADLPAYCRQWIAHAEVRPGLTIPGILKREQAQVDLANVVIQECAKLYLEEQARLSYETNSGQ